jgi:hypothetical protein
MKMKAAVLAATFALGATVAFAANPFSDVPSDSWAYQSVSQLAQAGIVNGYPDGTFRGQNDITRYEMAQMVAKAMAHQDKATAEQRAMINKLADEFADELNSLGVRVTNLENKVGNVKTTGDMRVRYQRQDNGMSSDKSSPNSKDSRFDMRARIQFNAQIDPNTTGTVRISTGNEEFGHSSEQGNNNLGNDDIYLDLAAIQHNFGSKVSVVAGRYLQYIGATTWWYGDHVDGAALKYNDKNFTFTGGYANFLEMEDNTNAYHAGQAEGGYATINGQFGKNVNIGAEYIGVDTAATGSNGGDAYVGKAKDAWGINTKINFSNFTLAGDYIKVQLDDSTNSDPTFWAGTLYYKMANPAKTGTYDIFVDYVNADNGAFLGGTNGWRPTNLLNNAKSWGVGADYVLAKGLTLTAFQTFSSSAKDGDTDPEEYTRVQVAYSF